MQKKLICLSIALTEWLLHTFLFIYPIIIIIGISFVRFTTVTLTESFLFSGEFK